MKHTIREVKLNNGAKGLIVHAPGVEVVNFLVEFRAGFNLHSWQKYELPHVMEHLMFTNRTYPKPRQFSKEVEKNGAFNNAYTSSSSLEYEYECAEFEAARIAKLLAIQITEPTFPVTELKSEIGNVREELSGNLSNYARLSSDNLYSAAIKRPDLVERIKQLPTIEVADIQKHYQHTHTGPNMRFIIAGDTNFEALTKILDVGLPSGQRLKKPKIIPQGLGAPLVESKEVDQIYYNVFSQLNVEITYRQAIAARIITNILTNGFSSTLFGLARQRGLIYSLGMGVEFDMYDATWWMNGSVSRPNSQRFFKLAATEIIKAQNGSFSQAQFKATKTLMLGERARGYQRVGNLTSFYDSYFEKDEINEFEEFNKLLLEITKEEAVTTFNQLFKDGWGISFVGKVDKALAGELTAELKPLWRS